MNLCVHRTFHKRNNCKRMRLTNTLLFSLAVCEELGFRPSTLYLKVKFTLEQSHEGPEGEQMYSSPLPSTSALAVGWVVSATPRPLYPRERPGTHCTGGWVRPRAGLDGCGKSRPHRDSIPGPSSPQRVAIPTGLSRPTYFKVSVTKQTAEARPGMRRL